MGDDDDEPEHLILIVVGSALRAEEADRPLGYYLKQQIEAALAERESDAASWRVVVMADFRWIHDDDLQKWPTISLGGPGVNALAQRWLEEVPLSLAVDEQFFVQMDPDLDDLRVSIWGMTNASTQIAVSAFLQRFLPRYLEHLDQAAEDLDLESFDDE